MFWKILSTVVFVLHLLVVLAFWWLMIAFNGGMYHDPMMMTSLRSVHLVGILSVLAELAALVLLWIPRRTRWLVLPLLLVAPELLVVGESRLHESFTTQHEVRLSVPEELVAFCPSDHNSYSSRAPTYLLLFHARSHFCSTRTPDEIVSTLHTVLREQGWACTQSSQGTVLNAPVLQCDTPKHDAATVVMTQTDNGLLDVTFDLVSNPLYHLLYQ